jgi:cytosine/uracil/thiamine/allantoin permease
MGGCAAWTSLTGQLNRDNVPLPPARRQWGAWSYVGYWLATGVNISGWTSGSTLLSLGLSVGRRTYQASADNQARLWLWPS